MQRLPIEAILLSTLLSTCCGVNPDLISPDLVNTKVQRTVDLSSHLAKISHSIQLENIGKSSVRSFLFAVDAELSDSLSYIGATIKSGEEDAKLKVTETTVANEKDRAFFRVNLASTLEGGKSVTIDVDTSFSHILKPYPSEISQADKQFVRFNGNLYFLSPYKTTTQTTIINCASSNIESYTKTKPVSTSDSTITYGPHENVAPFTQADITVHYENNSPFLTVTHMTRLIEVSHWGNIAVEETIDIRHTGAMLKGPFSRYDYQKTQGPTASIKSFKTVLPASAKDVYYRDEIGNISTSALRELDDMVEVELRPRFPLFGGWKTHYLLGYNVPSYQYLFNEGDHYGLKMRFMDHIYDDQVVDELTVRIILPEGAKNIDFRAPYPVERLPDELHYTYLDTFGRPVIIARKTNLAEQHVQDFELHYNFQKVLLLQEPLLVVAAFYLLFVTVIVYVRLDFSITKDEASESRMRVASLLEQVQGVQDRRSALYQSYDDAVNKYKSSKDATAFNTNRKKIDVDYKQLTGQINSMLAQLKSEGSETAEKVSELQRLDNLVKEQINLGIQYAEKLMAGKVAKPAYIEFEATTKAKREDLYGKMDGIFSTL